MLSKVLWKLSLLSTTSPVTLVNSMTMVLTILVGADGSGLRWPEDFGKSIGIHNSCLWFSALKVIPLLGEFVYNCNGCGG
jgi:hypothetical protein